MSLTVGVLALQGDVSEHCKALNACGVKSVAIKYEKELSLVDGLIIPGGESTTIAKLSFGRIEASTANVTTKDQNLVQKISNSLTGSNSKISVVVDKNEKLIPEENLINKIKGLGLGGMPIYGTCMGSIFLAKHIENNINQFSMQLMDIKVSRNAFGPQKNSFETNLNIDFLGRQPFKAIFIRAPLIIDVGENVEILANLPNYVETKQEFITKAVMVREKNFLATAFHPELTSDYRIHQYFIDMIKK